MWLAELAFQHSRGGLHAMQMTVDAKLNYFDRDRVKRSIRLSVREPLIRSGALVRTIARRSIRRRRKSSLPGQPPHAHGKGLIKRISFWYNESRQSVSVGPDLLNVGRRRRVPARGTVPFILEYGGNMVMTRARDHRVIRYHQAARPFMRPALAKALPKIRDLFRKKVRIDG